MAITASVLPLLLQRADTAWRDNQTFADYSPNVGVLQAIQAQQTAAVVPLTERAIDQDVKVVWMNHCDIPVVDCVDSCTFAGTEASSDSKTYVVSECKESEFKANMDGFNGNEFAMTDSVEKSLLSVFKGHADAAAVYAVGVIEANLGVNVWDQFGTWTIAGTNTTIPADQWNMNLLNRLQMAGVKNKFNNSFLLSGTNLWEEYQLARQNSRNLDGAGNDVRSRLITTYFDEFNIDEVTGDYVTYLIARGALAFASKTYYSTNVERVPGRDAHDRFSVSNPFFPSLRHDVQRTTQCSGGDTYEHWKIKTRFDVFTNPLGCTATRTGLLRLEREAGI